MDVQEEREWYVFDVRKHKRGMYEAEAKVRVYVWPVGENVLANVRNRRSRPYTDYRKLLPEILQEAGVIEKGDAFKASWRQTAGCNCGCSPGFILDGHWGFDVHVDVAYATPEQAGVAWVEKYWKKMRDDGIKPQDIGKAAYEWFGIENDKSERGSLVEEGVIAGVNLNWFKEIQERDNQAGA